ncbi:leucine-rich repeat and guanylate kinase domain-containing protein-like isoform X2 [Anthonomus grandis grandis]|nr:leucine-rich repeat and guanylate kinase domain-containing protein-like isoform X2 [Anthonomus grandis grandis]
MEEDPVIVPDIAELVTQQTLPGILNDLFYAEMRTAEMTNLGNILLGYNTESTQDDSQIGRLSLAHEKLTHMPKIVCDEFGPHIKILDITNNRFKNLDFLEHFPKLTTLIADRNPINSTDTNIPWLPKLELLYLNHCKIDELYWVETLRYNCPNLKYLSLMGNPVVPSFMTRANMYQYLQYRFYVISVIPNLIHLDDKKITEDERIQAKNMYPTQFVQNLFKATRARFPHYLRRLTGRMNNYFSIVPGKKIQRNVVI